MTVIKYNKKKNTYRDDLKGMGVQLVKIEECEILRLQTKCPNLNSKYD